MATMNFSVPDNIKKRFNQIFADENKSHIITEFMQQAIEDYEKQQRRIHAIDALLKLRAKQKPVTNRMIQLARHKGRP
ncbi:hypothetical protein AYO45_00600 [Gammaproteobacteria bacterium SCGC AG-212-F23]|nr:hypothetical protein AYO45_00600 [Gammaproteobacteria bacterium SCGC AG-212-F23]